MKILADTHTHTIASGHAYSTVDENARWAAEQGLRLLALTDHAPAMQNTTCHAYFANLNVIPQELRGVRILRGVELNILEKLFFATHGIDVRHVIRIEEQIGSEPSQLMPIYYGMYLDIIAGQMPDDAEAVVVDHPLFVLEEEQRSVYAERLGRPILFNNEILLDAALRRMEAGG